MLAPIFSLGVILLGWIDVILQCLFPQYYHHMCERHCIPFLFGGDVYTLVEKGWLATFQELSLEGQFDLQEKISYSFHLGKSRREIVRWLPRSCSTLSIPATSNEAMDRALSRAIERIKNSCMSEPIVIKIEETILEIFLARFGSHYFQSDWYDEAWQISGLLGDLSHPRWDKFDPLLLRPDTSKSKILITEWIRKKVLAATSAPLLLEEYHALQKAAILSDNLLDRLCNEVILPAYFTASAISYFARQQPIYDISLGLQRYHSQILLQTLRLAPPAWLDLTHEEEYFLSLSANRFLEDLTCEQGLRWVSRPDDPAMLPLIQYIFSTLTSSLCFTSPSEICSGDNSYGKVELTPGMILRMKGKIFVFPYSYEKIT